MKVEIIGGPKDGSMMEVPDDWQHLVFVVHDGQIKLPDLADAPFEAVVSASMPIERSRSRFFVRWPKGAL